MVVFADTYYSAGRRSETPAFVHNEQCWPETGKLSPCEAVCPIGQDVPNYVMALARGDVAKALSIIRETNPLPSVCGRVCHHPCETECNRKVLDDPIAIRALKQYAADNGGGKPPRAVKKTKKARVAIVGSGPAGLSAAHDLVKKGYGVTVFESAQVPGGILASAIPDFILSPEALAADIDYIKALGADIHCNVRVGRDVSVEALANQGFGAVLVAIGAQKSAPLKVPGADAAGVTPALEFLTEAKQRRLTSVKGNVWIIGGGAVAMDCARTAVRLGASEVHVACLERRADMPSFDWEIAEAEREGVKVHPGLAPQRFTTSKGSSRVNGIVFKRVTSTTVDSQGRISWTLAEGQGSDFTDNADSVIIAVGQATDTTGLPEGQLKISKRGTVNVNDATGETSMVSVFAAGDITSGRGTVTESMAAGRRAATSIDQYLSGGVIAGADGTSPMITIESEQVPAYMVRRDQWDVPKLSGKQATTTFKEVDIGYSSWQAQAEAERCLNCRMCANCIFERGQLCLETAGRLLLVSGG